jgi:flagellar hook-associated protein 2
MADYLSGNITFTGIGSGTDFQSVIEGLVEVEGIQKRRMEAWKETWEAKIEALQGLNTKLLALDTTLKGMDTPDEFEVKTATSSNTDVLTATADAEAATGTHTITVNQLATNDVLTNSTQHSTKDEQIAFSNASFDYTYKGESVSLDVPDGATLADLKDIINSDSDNPGVRASIVSDGSYYYLQLRGLDLGEDADLTIDASTTVPDFGPGHWDNTQDNQSALFRIDGWPAGSWISNSSNTVTGALEGITLNLKSSGASPPTDVSLTVDTDQSSIKENVRTFVDQVNEVRTAIQDLTKIDETTEKGSILTGNYGVENLVGQTLKDIIASKAVGFKFYDAATGTGDQYSSLAQVGILTDADEDSPTNGLLVLDESVLDDALADDPDAVTELFSADYRGESRSTDFSYDSHVSGITEAGTYDVEYTISGGSVTSAKINGHDATVDGWTLTGASGHPEAGLALGITNQADGSYSGEVSLKLGKTGELSESLGHMTSSTDGPIHILEDNYEDIIDNIDKKIEREENRLTRMETRLRNKFARLEALLGRYDQISAQLSGQLANLPTGGG